MSASFDRSPPAVGTADCAPHQPALNEPCVEAVRQFTSGLAHEGRNALQQITACAELLAMELAEVPESLDLINGILDAGGRLQQLFDDVRAYSMKLQLDCRCTDLSTVWQAAWRRFEAAHPDHQVQLREPELGGDFRAYVSSQHIERVFLKLFENAADACHGSGTVEVGCREAELNGRRIQTIWVHDSGSGFSPEALANAFTLFYSSKAHGNGLGLATARRIVEAHGGQISAANASEGGALVQMTLPAE